MSKANKSNKAIKYRLYPNDEQKVMFAKTFGCCRFVYNQLLALQKQKIQRWRIPSFLSLNQMSSLLVH